MNQDEREALQDISAALGRWLSVLDEATESLTNARSELDAAYQRFTDAREKERAS